MSMNDSLSFGSFDGNDWQGNAQTPTEAVHQPQLGDLLNLDMTRNWATEEVSSVPWFPHDGQLAPSMQCSHIGCMRTFSSTKALMRHVKLHTNQEKPLLAPSDDSLSFGSTFDGNDWQGNAHTPTEAVHQQGWHPQLGDLTNLDMNWATEEVSSVPWSPHDGQPAPSMQCHHTGCTRTPPSTEALMLHARGHKTQEKPLFAASDATDLPPFIDNPSEDIVFSTNLNDHATPQEEENVTLALEPVLPKGKRKNGPKRKRSAFTVHEQAEFDALPPPPETVPNGGHLARPVLVEDKLQDEIIWFNPRVSPIESLAEGERLSLVCQNWSPETKYSNPFRCVYVDPWEFTVCEKAYKSYTGWKQHFRSHASRERSLVDAGTRQFEECVALKDPRFQAMEYWKCSLCGFVGRTHRPDPLLRHMLKKHDNAPESGTSTKRAHEDSDSVDGVAFSDEPPSKRARKR